MKLSDFLETISKSGPPEELPETLQSLWWDKKGNWELAHSIAQDIPSVQGSAVHAYLHREEGVMWNADYWYAKAGRVRPAFSLEQEWRELAEEMLGGF